MAFSMEAVRPRQFLDNIYRAKIFLMASQGSLRSPAHRRFGESLRTIKDDREYPVRRIQRLFRRSISQRFSYVPPLVDKPVNGHAWTHK
jgi:hypothetical protein